jgi:hypothetical protein
VYTSNGDAPANSITLQLTGPPNRWTTAAMKMFDLVRARAHATLSRMPGKIGDQLRRANDALGRPLADPEELADRRAFETRSTTEPAPAPKPAPKGGATAAPVIVYHMDKQRRDVPKLLDILDANGVPYKVMNIQEDPAAQYAVRRDSNGQRLPVVFVAGECIGGREPDQRSEPATRSARYFAQRYATTRSDPGMERAMPATDEKSRSPQANEKVAAPNRADDRRRGRDYPRTRSRPTAATSGAQAHREAVLATTNQMKRPRAVCRGEEARPWRHRRRHPHPQPTRKPGTARSTAEEAQGRAARSCSSATRSITTSSISRSPSTRPSSCG